ncbi:MAG: MBL fold metallo-hydrolase [Thermoplasmata archaeon]
MEFEPIWFDSLGAKSSCILVRTDSNFLIDPGVSQMHPGFPASSAQKRLWHQEAGRRIASAAGSTDVVIVSHYHYDHYTDFERGLYEGKLVLVKNPNQYINDSQRRRSMRFFENLCRTFGERTLKEVLERPRTRRFGDPMEDLTVATDRDFQDYQERREELLEKGRRWFLARARKWKEYGRVPELEFRNLKVRFIDGQRLTIGKTRLRFSRPFFHGIEYSRVGWVCSTVIEFGGEKLIHTSDINGPIIEDYAEWLIEENPQVLILDGPMTYMLGYMLNLTNLRRAIENMLRIVRETDTELIIYDHHLPRERKFREHTGKVWELAEKLGRRVSTAAELMGRKPAVLTGG